MILINVQRLLNWKSTSEIHHYRSFDWMIIGTQCSTNLIRYDIRYTYKELKLSHVTSFVLRKDERKNIVERVKIHIDSLYSSPLKNK